MKMAYQSEISLCRHCLEREGIKGTASKNCDLCGGILAELPKRTSEIAEKLSKYEYETFLIGASIPQTVLDREDELRSRLKIKGKESVKSQITRMLTRNISKTTGKRSDYSRPDLAVLLSLADGYVQINPRSIWLSARYTKSSRGIPQRSSDCRQCNGLGCAACNYSGRSGKNIQSVATAFFCKKFGAESCNFVWLGSEDENSLVEGSGRPFFAEVLRPKIRLTGSDRSKFRTRLAFKSKDIKLTGIYPLEKRITEVPQFNVTCVVHLVKNETDSPQILSSEEIERNFSQAIVTIRLSRKYRMVQRMIHSIIVKPLNGGAKVDLIIKCEGGVPIKKLITNEDGSVEPNLSTLLAHYTIDQERPFDVLDVSVRKGHAKYGQRGQDRPRVPEGSFEDLDA
ncbi:MAG: hypothetical protein JRN20_13910 [Nitrososphaerota archaeon]|nr:hypothetical protein [Nitrososphaerota archaeon]MDG6922499.1 hypothetical protein [Nitrososphaerota archaeon]